jgi:hypothetical protein
MIADLRQLVANRQMLRPAHEQRLHVRRLSGELDPLQPGEQLIVERARFHPGQVGTEAEVRPKAEPDVVVRVAPHLENIGPVEDLLIAVGRRMREQYRISLRDRNSYPWGAQGSCRSRAEISMSSLVRDASVNGSLNAP